MSSNIFIVFQKEFTERVFKRSFIIATLLTPLLFVGLMLLPTLLAMYGDHSTAMNIAVVDESLMVVDSLAKKEGDITYIKVEESQSSQVKDVVDRYSSDATLVIPEDVLSGADITIYSNASLSFNSEHAIKRDIEDIVYNLKLKSCNIEGIKDLIDNLENSNRITTIITDNDKERQSSAEIPSAIAYIFAMMIYMFIIVYASRVMQSVIDEKSNRIVELIISAVTPFQLMVGKITSVAAVAVVQFGIWCILTTVISGAIGSVIDVEEMSSSYNATSITSTLDNTSYIAGILVTFILYFVGGFLLYAAMFAMVGSMVDNLQDAQQFTLPVTLPLIAGILIMMSTMRSPDGDMAFWASMIPFTSSVTMMARMPFGVPLWEVIVSLIVLYVSVIGMTFVAAKIFRVGILMYGKKVTWSEAFKWLKY